MIITHHAHVSQTTLSDIDELLTCIRDVDVREIADVGNKSPRDNLLLGLMLGEPCLSLRTIEDEMIGILSVISSGNRSGIIAMVGSDLLEQNQKAFLRGSKDVLAFLDKQYDLLYNICDARNTVHHKWLKWLGFTFFALKKYENIKVPVYEFARLK